MKTLDKYISHHTLDHLKSCNKPQKVEGIRLHFLRHLLESNGEPSASANDTDDTDTGGGSSDDEVLRTCRASSDADDAYEDASLFRTNRYGRAVGVSHHYQQQSDT